ncbi:MULTISPECIES: non-ribosomal peptide synthase/polyketide synthase [unclassified Pseudomonas]|uniref:non-ribosomal peptide synthase/polyketide synthase n=5 Tax=Pseudomonas TaxID=286 RepID=UPI000C86A152|nr:MULTISPECIES: non-ribosomal peptide synthase/polyketide synthase [unclassified Pseudomonas]PMU22634.1 non-ribosomal peptide synthetase [Pseudomonas sp. GP01-A9]PMU28405.1 non-ribosomal peptide synthetase [Pseudomonas sp. GP01-A13]PMU42466.1 non-ribosomal peptide synthetase [Pseudomonas sp. GP01-A8]PMU52150.1 non-ribosomal peptide synthetase [Pseudomonas sp. GP01-A6]PMU63379.1 non-ribosomal peptide synthetase [Pseudomonas sp. GP01-A3]
MDTAVAQRIARRFITLPLEKRRLYLQKMLEEDVSPANLPIPPVSAEFDTLSLSFAQERQWFLWQLDPESAAYHMPTALRLRGPLDIAALQQSFSALVARHESLRTTFVVHGEQVVQQVQEAAPVNLQVQPLAQVPDAAQLRHLIEDETRRLFDLQQGPLLRTCLLQLGADDHVLIVTLHHIVSDGWSMQVMVEELVKGYAAFSRGLSLELPALPIQYSDYAIWQRHWMEAGERERQLQYWTAQLGGEQPVLELPTDVARPAVMSYRGARLELDIDAALACGLKQMAQREGVSLFMILLASYQALLHRYSGQNDIRVGVPTANRNRVETEGLIGFFVNTQVLKSEVDSQGSFSALLQQVKQTALDAQAHQDLPFEQLVEALQPQRNLSHSPLFQVMFNHQTQGPAGEGPAGELKVEGLRWDTHSAQFDLTLETMERPDGLSAALIYATDLFGADTVARMAGHWQNLLQAIIANPAQSIGELPLLDAEQRQAQLDDCVRTSVATPQAGYVHRLFEAQVARSPEAQALVINGQRLSYGQLNTRANQLAVELQRHGVGAGVLVGIAVERSPHMLIGLLAILKAGGAYLPLDPAFPQDRLAYMIEDSGIDLLLTQHSLLSQIPVPDTVTTLVLDQPGNWLDGHAGDDLPTRLDPEHLAYVIYTSGSTGQPKGVMVRHGALTNFVASMARVPGMTAQDRALSLTTFSFDIFGLEIYVPLMVGACIVLTGQEVAQDPYAVLALIDAEQVNVVQATPSTWRMLLDNEQAHVLQGCTCLCGGEALPQELAVRMLGLGGEVWNLYGPTETTVWSALHRLRPQAAQPWLGGPIDNTSLYIVGADLMPVPYGVAGELLIGGDGLARGYFQRPGLTAERFVPHPFSSTGERLYRTGDLARQRPDGILEYLGRIDHQVKIRGFRIELGEIEARLLEQDAVREAAVLAQDAPGGQALVAYVVPAAEWQGLDADGQGRLRDSLNARLKANLPDYMVPAHMVLLPRFPLTPNGKLDRRQLPKPDASQWQKTYVAAQTPVQQAVAAIWAEVLNVPRVGLSDNFFELGGHSLLATQMVSRIRQQLQVQVPLRLLFAHNTLQAFVEAMAPASLTPEQAIPRVARDQPLALSYAQQRQWFLWQLEPTSSAYHIPAALRLRGHLDLAALQQCFDALVARHESLRTRFVLENERPVQRVDAPAPVAIALESAAAGLDDPGLRGLIETETRQLFDLQRGPLLRVKLLQLGAEDHVLILTQHHIVSDAWSMRVMIDELMQLYRGFSQGQPAALAALPIQYADYAQWQRQWLAAGEQQRQLSYWTEQLGGEQPVLELPTDHPRPVQQSYRGARLPITLEPSLAESLKRLAQQQNTTLFMLLLAGFQTLLHRYSGQQDIRVGVPIANRNRLETEGMLGFFVNTQVLRADIEGHLRFDQLLHQVKQRVLGAQAHQDLPFEQLVELLAPARNLSHTPLFQAMFNHASDARREAIELPGLSLEQLTWDSGSVQFDLSLDTFEYSEGISAALSYASDLFEPATVARLGEHWLNLLRAIVANPTQRIAELPMLDAVQRRMMVEDWNRTFAHYPNHQPVHHLIEAQVERAPHAVALVFEGQSLTYAQLNARANRLAHALIARGVGPDVLVGIALHRSLEMVVGLLAILKAGGAYVPLDPEYPPERLSYMIDDSGIEWLLTQQALVATLPLPERVRTLILDGDDAWLAGEAQGNPESRAVAQNLAYVIYTSGSTGKPKGAGNSHGALTNRLCWMQQAYGLHADDRVLQKTPFSFDVSVWEFFWPLMTGVRLVVASPGDHRDPQKLVQLIEREGITTLHFVPSMLQAFVLDANVSRCTSLTRIVCSGEALPIDAQQQVFAKLPGAGLFNLYGPTEAAIDVTHWTCRDEGRDAVPIGEPIANLMTYILDAELNPVPCGVNGELYLSGQGLARGYHRRPELTAERFVASPFVAGERLYRTGDLARYRVDGVIDYIGRIDHQVKIRGFRIELGEIEARLLEHGAVREAVVVAQDSRNGKALSGYVVTQPGAPSDWPALREALTAHLRQTLPEHMVPTHLTPLEKMPLSPNGKLDRKALPVPDMAEVQQDFVAPANAVESALVEIWQAVLGVARVGTADNFFALGGDSINSIQVVSRARQQGIGLAPKDLFLHQNIQALARAASADQAATIDQGPVNGDSHLVPMQHWFFANDMAHRDHWNQSLMLTPREPLDGACLQQALEHVVAHHDALRLRFVQSGDGTWQASHEAVGAQPVGLWQRQAENADEIIAIANQAQRSLDLQHGPLLRCSLIAVQDGSSRLHLAIHHLVMDGVSWRVLLEDLQTAYRQLAVNQPVVLPPKSTAFKAWAEQLQGYAHSEGLARELSYWTGQQAHALPELPRARPEGSQASVHGHSVNTRLDTEQTRRLLKQAPSAYRTQVNDLLLSALAQVICQWTAQPACLVQLEGHGREELFGDVDLSRTLGWFTSLFPVVLTPSVHAADTIKGIKEQLRAVPNKGLGYGVLRYLGAEDVRSRLAKLAQARITFNYLGQFDQSFDEQALFAPSEEGSGAGHADDVALGNWLTIDGRVYNGQLSLDWTFSRDVFDEATVQQLADAYGVALQALIEHCCGEEHQGLTPSDFPLARLTQAHLDGLPVPVAQVQDVYALSPMQEGMLFHTLADDSSGLYINQISLPVHGLDTERFAAAWQSVIEREDILRTSFHWQDGLSAPVQIVHRQAELPLLIEDWRGQDISEQAIGARATADYLQGFDLARAPLQRVLLLRLEDDRYQMIWTCHHILMDGWSSSRLFGEVMQFYAQGHVPTRNGRYREFIEWLQRQDQRALEGFWRSRLATLEQATSLNQAMFPRHVEDLPGHQALYSRWDAVQTARLQQACRALQITPNTLIQGAWLLLLQRFTGQNTVVFGATVAGRPAGLANADNILGLFINTLPVIQTLEPAQPLDQWLQALQACNMDIREHAHAPLADIQRWSGLGGQGLFDSIIVFENYPIDERLGEQQDTGLSFGESRNHDVTNFAMDLAVNLGEQLSIEYLFLRNAFSVEAVEQIRRCMEDTLEAMIVTPTARLGNLQRLGAEQWRAFEQWSAAPNASYHAQLLPELIARHADSRGEATALVCGGDSLSYGELERRANGLAHRLIELGAGPEVVVGVALERSVEMIVALLAVMKSGAAYVPLDIDYPPERLAFMMQDSAMALLLTHSQVQARLPAVEGLAQLAIDTFDRAGYSDTPPASSLLGANLAYLIYTSGSTGRPKGVAVAHGPMSMHCQAIAGLYDMDERTRELHFMSFAFDGAHERWLSTLLSGGTLVIRDASLWTPEQTFDALHQHGITIACFPPAYLKQLAEYAAHSQQEPPAVRVYCFGGDAVPDQTFEQVKAALRPQFFTNGYGPTETVVTPMLWKVPVDTRCEAAYAPIGRAVGERALYVLDEDLNPLPPGIAGELYIGGQGIARGYYRRPDLSAERFVPDPFGSPGDRLYRSGDLVRQRVDGVLDYVGRIDHQIKVRGFRIELGEIEASLRQLDDVSDALVIARDSASGKQLIGYVVTPDGMAIGDRLKADLRAQLPDYMVPTQVICMAALPVTPNGKLDRQALPEPEFKGGEYVPGRTRDEQLLAQVWADVLQVERVGITDNFFELGGDSILSLQVVSRVRNHPELKMDLKLRDLMRGQTIEAIFEQRSSTVATLIEDVSQVAAEGQFNLIPIQQWLFDQRMSEPHHYNQALMLRARQALNLPALELALRCMLKQHDALRLRFREVGARYYQHYQPLEDMQAQWATEPLLWQHTVADEAELELYAEQVQRSLDLQDGPVWRTAHVTLGNGQVRVLMVIHHLVIDTVSWRLLLQDLQVAYEAYRNGQAPALPIRTSSYRAWAEGLQAYAANYPAQEQAWWLEQIDQPGSELPCDNPRGKNQVQYQSVALMGLSQEHTQQLLKQVPAVYQTQINDVLLAALSRVLCRWSGQPSVLIQLEGHGREDLVKDIDLSRSLGWFTSMFPVRLAPGAGADIGSSVRAVQRQLAAVPNKGLGYGILRHMSGVSMADTLRLAPQARVTFNYLGQFDQSFDDKAMLVPAQESYGSCYSPQAALGNWLEVVGQVYDGRLAMRCIFSTRRYRAETVEQLMREYQAELEALIEHCVAQAA